MENIAQTLFIMGYALLFVAHLIEAFGL